MSEQKLISHPFSVREILLPEKEGSYSHVAQVFEATSHQPGDPCPICEMEKIAGEVEVVQ